MASQTRFLLINGGYDRYWQEVLGQALAPLGSLQVSRENDALALVQLGSYDLLIIDATAVESVPLLLERIRCQWPEARIIIATASPTWVQAREAFQAGAIDYIRKSLDREELRSTIQAGLDRMLLP